MVWITAISVFYRRNASQWKMNRFRHVGKRVVKVFTVFCCCCFWHVQEYPTLGQLIEKVVENNILLIFAVTDNVRKNYQVRTTATTVLSSHTTYTTHAHTNGYGWWTDFNQDHTEECFFSWLFGRDVVFLPPKKRNARAVCGEKEISPCFAGNRCHDSGFTSKRTPPRQTCSHKLPWPSRQLWRSKNNAAYVPTMPPWANHH